MAALADQQPRTLREISQSKFLNDVICGGDTWKVMVMDETATRIISSALTMYDIMERKVTLVEQLALNRQPFPEMDVIYFISPKTDSVRRVLNDFQSLQKAKYANVHIVFTSAFDREIMSMLQSNAVLVSKIKTLKEIFLDFLSPESNTYNLDQKGCLPKLFSSMPDPAFPRLLGAKLASLCITLNEHPSIRYQGSSGFARDIATTCNEIILKYKRDNGNSFWIHGDDANSCRGQLLILDRSFDPVSPLMHEYTYQAMANDLLPVEEGVVSYMTTVNKGGGAQVEKQAVLSEADEIWAELRHSHIAKVIESVRGRMSDMLEHSKGANLQKKGGASMSISDMGAAVKELPEYQQTMSKLGQHVAIASQCMEVFTKQGLMDISQVEQTISTGVTEDGTEIKGSKLVQMMQGVMADRSVKRALKLRLLAIFYLTQRSVSSSDKQMLCHAAGLTGPEQQVLLNFNNLSSDSAFSSSSNSGGSGGAKEKGGLFSMFRSRATPQKHDATPEGEYSDTRHVCALKILLEQLIAGELPTDRFPVTGPAQPTSDTVKTAAKSVRKFGANSRWGRKDQSQFTGGRYIVFCAGGISYSELRVGYECMQAHAKEVIVGGSHLLSPGDYIDEVGSLHLAGR